MLSFLNPWAIALGALAITGPLVVHFFTRPRPRPYYLSTIRFVYEAIQERKSRSRLRDLLVLLARMVAIALLASAIARPFLKQSVVQADSREANVARVVMLDTSLSMAAGRGGGQPIERARGVADQYLKYANGLTANVVTVGARAEGVFEEMSVNLPALRQRVMRAEATGQRANVTAAIRLAGELLASAPENAERELIVISDFQRSNWGVADFESLPVGTKVQLESVALDSAVNTAVTDVRFQSRVVAGRETSIEVELTHFGSETAEGTCALSIGPWTLEQPVSLSEGKRTLSFVLTPDQAGWFGGVVLWKGRDDALVADDRRPIVLQVADAPRVLLVSSESPELRPSAGYYLERALEALYGSAVKDAEARSPGVVRLTTAAATENVLASADVIVLDHPGRLRAEQAELIARLTRRGRGLLMVVSDLVDGGNTKLLSSSLGAEWQIPVTFLSPRGERPRKDLRVSEASRTEPPFSIFGDRLQASLTSVRISGGLPTELTDAGLKDRVPGWLEDRTAWLVTAPCGSGRITIMNADLGISNFGTQPAFLPILGQLIEELLPRELEPPQVAAGEPLARELAADVSLEDALNVEPFSPWTENEAGYGGWEPAAGGVLWKWGQPDHVGAYQVKRAGEPVAAIAVQSPAIESELASLSGDVFADRLSGTREVGFRDARQTDEGNDRVWNWLLAFCLMTMVGEFAVHRMLGR